MATQVPREVKSIWGELESDSAETGKGPTPFVDSITMDPDRPPSISLIAPGLVEGTPSVFVAVERMPPADRLALQVLLDVLQGLLHLFTDTGVSLSPRDFAPGQFRDFWAVYHVSGTNYEFYGPDSLIVQSADLGRAARRLIWGVLRATAVLGSKYPDEEASTVYPPGQSQSAIS